jgi:hypothetical protein
MLRAIRNRVTPSTVIATVALVFAMTGGAYAANKYLITSTKQISPKVLKVLKALKGSSGANGVAGAAGPGGPGGPQGPAGAGGPAGAKGATGAAGKDGKTGFTEFLPPNDSERGTWGVAGQPTTTPFGEDVSASISFNIPLKEAPAVHVIKPEATPPAGCSGTVTEPQAEPGNLCVFTTFEQNVKATGPFVFSPETGEGAGKAGAVMFVPAAAAGGIAAAGDWVVTAR